MVIRVYSPRCACFDATNAPSWAHSCITDTFETFFDARIDLWERRLRQQGQNVIKGTKDVLKRRGIDSNIDRELDKLKKTVSVPS